MQLAPVCIIPCGQEALAVKNFPATGYRMMYVGVVVKLFGAQPGAEHVVAEDVADGSGQSHVGNGARAGLEALCGPSPASGPEFEQRLLLVKDVLQASWPRGCPKISGLTTAVVATQLCCWQRPAGLEDDVMIAFHALTRSGA